MALIHILGSCSGTEPMQGRQHTAWVLEVGDRLYWFDAGENCSWTAMNLGLDVHKVRQIFISHPHTDHTAGLPNLLWNIHKMMFVRKLTQIPPVELFTPSIPLADSVLTFLDESWSSIRSGYVLHVRKIADGPLFQDENLTVEARHNLHLGAAPDGDWHSFSFRLTLGKQVIVYSGDVDSLDDMGDWTRSCDWFLMESGHHHPVEIAAELARRKASIRNLLWLHHGRRLLTDISGSLLAEAAKALPETRMLAATDRMTLAV
jgi:ribonuclease BN (tRNA processing enzyme)